MIEKRLFVGNLPLDVRRKDIKRKFADFGNVEDVTVKHRKDDADNIISAFAFVNIKGDAADLNNCVNEISRQDWNGHRVKVEYAKEDFLTILEKERNQHQDGGEQAVLKSMKRKTSSQSDLESKPPKITSVYNSESASEKTENINRHEKYKGRLKMFGGTRSSQSQSIVDAKKKSESNTRYNGDVMMKRFEIFSDVWKDSNESQWNTVHFSSFRSCNTKNGDEDESNFCRSRQKNLDYGFEIAKSESRHTEFVKPYISGSDSEEDFKGQWNIKVLQKGAKKFRKDTINDSYHARRNEAYNKSTPFRKEDKCNDNFKWNKRKNNINGHIEDDTMDAEETVCKTLQQMKRWTSQIRSNERRKKSVLENIKARSEKMKLIKDALRQVDSTNRANKKIVFSDADDSDNDDNNQDMHENKKSASKKSLESSTGSKNGKQQKLFDDDEGLDSDMNEGMSKLKINKQFEGPKGEKLLELQSRYAHDDRFALDSRFYESDNEDSDENRSNFRNNTEEKDEVSKQLEVLEDVLGYQITKKPESDKKKKKQHEMKQDTALLRFDPTKSEHSKYVITKPSTSDTTTESLPAKKKKLIETEVDIPKNQTEVSKERFYKIDESLTKSLKRSSAKSSGFSVLELIGSKPDEDKNENKVDENHYVAESKNLPFKSTLQPRNPFRYDSSDTEEEDEQQPVHDNKQSPSHEEDNAAPFFGLWTDTFFLKDKDSRLKEAADFFMNEEDLDETDFARQRKYLKGIVKWKNKNYLKTQEKQQFKTKLGGHSKNRNSKSVKRKHISWKVRKFQNQNRKRR